MTLHTSTALSAQSLRALIEDAIPFNRHLGLKLESCDPALVGQLATIDMRVDYLTPSKGQELLATSSVMRSGKRVVVVRSEVHDDQGALVALGSTAFSVVG